MTTSIKRLRIESVLELGKWRLLKDVGNGWEPVASFATRAEAQDALYAAYAAGGPASMAQRDPEPTPAEPPTERSWLEERFSGLITS